MVLTQVRKQVSPAHEPFRRSAGFSPPRRPPDQRAERSHAPRQPRPLKRTKVRAPTAKGSRAQSATRIRRNLSMNLPRLVILLVIVIPLAESSNPALNN